MTNSGEKIKRLKDQEFRYATIKIDKIREVHKIGKGSYEFKDKMYCVDIKQHGLTTSFCQPTLKKLFRNIKEILHI